MRRFDPERWVTATSGNWRLLPIGCPTTSYWGAQAAVMAFTDDDIRAIVETGQYSDPRTVDWITTCLIERRDRIGAAFFAKVAPLEDFRVEDGELRFRDLGVEYGFAGERTYTLLWSEFDNPTQAHTNIGVPAPSLEIPPQIGEAAAGSYFAARIAASEEPEKAVEVFLRKEADGIRVVGIDRDWPGKTLADARAEVDPGATRYGDLDARQSHLFESYTAGYNEATGFSLTPRDYFNSLTISERTTFDAVTHALMNSELTDENGAPLGHAIDLVRAIERVAGQYYGRSGDEQFRLYVFLREGARDTLEQAQEFSLGHLNTVYHVGYPYSYRQGGNLPSIQFSISEDGTKADIDVDYRSSKMPAAMFNGHLTSANSDVRAGDNHERHAGRWSGFVAWWQDIFGRLPFTSETSAGTGIYSRERPEAPTPMPPDRPPTAEPEELSDAAQEFLTDWLVRRKVSEALLRLSDDALACLDTDDDVDDEILRSQGARAALQDAMELALEEQRDADNLTEAIDVVLPWRESVRVLEHTFAGEFSLLELTNADAAIYLCGNEPEGGIYRRLRDVLRDALPIQDRRQRHPRSRMEARERQLESGRLGGVRAVAPPRLPSPCVSRARRAAPRTPPPSRRGGGYGLPALPDAAPTWPRPPCPARDRRSPGCGRRRLRPSRTAGRPAAGRPPRRTRRPCRARSPACSASCRLSGPSRGALSVRRYGTFGPHVAEMNSSTAARTSASTLSLVRPNFFGTLNP